LRLITSILQDPHVVSRLKQGFHFGKTGCSVSFYDVQHLVRCLIKNETDSADFWLLGFDFNKVDVQSAS
jgi:hypothetical protein